MLNADLASRKNSIKKQDRSGAYRSTNHNDFAIISIERVTTMWNNACLSRDL